MNSFRAIGFVFTMFFSALAVAQPDDGGAIDVSRLIHQGKLEDAAKRLNAALDQHANHPQLRFLQGVIQMELKHFDAAIVHFQKMTVEFPHFAEPYNNLAVLYAKQGRLEKARAALELAIVNMPSYATAYENLAAIYAKMAEENYRKAALYDRTGTLSKQSQAAAVAQIKSE
jgi:Flp pilus assembly protein TadD